MECELLGWPEDGPTLRLDYREFTYAGKFVMSSTGKTVARDSGTVVGAVAFDEDRTDAGRLCLRYVTVRKDRRGEGIAPDLVEFVVEAARDRGYERVKIAVNNPFAFHALQKVGFRYTGEQTGLAELVLERPVGDPAPPDPEQYRAGLEVYARRELSEQEKAFVEARREDGPPNQS